MNLIYIISIQIQVFYLFYFKAMINNMKIYLRNVRIIIYHTNK